MATQDSTMRGVFDWVLNEEPKFVRFFELVQRAAGRLNKVFFLESGQGNEFETPDMEGENMVGWLVDESKADAFEQQWKTNIRNVDTSFDDDFVLVSWSNDDGEISIHFE